MRQEFCLNHFSGLNAQNVLSRILDQARLTGGLPKPVFLAFLSVALICVSRPRGERHVRRFFLSVYFRLQSARPRGGTTHRALLDVILQRISIHAPAWGATVWKTLLDEFVEISIHAPAWGATVPVYTGLITAVALYFSRTSFSAVLLQAFFVAKSSV